MILPLTSFFRNRTFRYAAVFLLTAVALFPSCLDKDDDTKTSNDATVASLTFSKNDNISGLKNAKFTIDSDLDTGLIYNEDSLPYLTRIDSVFPTFTFSKSPAGAILYTINDTITLSGNDTVDFSLRPTKLQVYASDGVTQKWYDIYVNVHQVNPDLYVWRKLADQIYTHEGSAQKAVWYNNQVNLFINTGINNYRYVSADGKTWQQTTISGLPANNNLQYLTVFNNALYLCSDDALYNSADAQTWTKIDMSGLSFKFTNLLFVFNDSLWSVVHDKTAKTYHLAHSADALTWIVGEETLPDNFPISDFASVTFTSPSGRPRAMIVGGLSAKGETLNTRWNVEWTPYGEYRWNNFSVEQPSFGSLAGTSIIWYGGTFLMFGGVDSDNQIMEDQMLESIDEGLNWLTPDTALNILPDTYTPRTRQAVCVDAENHILLIGGQTRSEVLSDVYSGQRNNINW